VTNDIRMAMSEKHSKRTGKRLADQSASLRAPHGLGELIAES
jgi:hypothetical protein